MPDFVKLSTDYGVKYINVNHILTVERCKTSYDMESKITLDVVKRNARREEKLMSFMCEDNAETVITKICGE